eukprot:2079141-Prymnesium_polylepis.1
MCDDLGLIRRDERGRTTDPLPIFGAAADLPNSFSCNVVDFGPDPRRLTAERVAERDRGRGQGLSDYPRRRVVQRDRVLRRVSIDVDAVPAVHLPAVWKVTGRHDDQLNHAV